MPGGGEKTQVGVEVCKSKLTQWMRSNTAQLLTPDTDSATDIPPG